MNVERFKQDHAAIMSSVTELKRLVQAGIADNAEPIARAIVSMSSTIKLHLAAEDRVLYPALTGSSVAATAQVAKKFQNDMGAIAAAYTEFSRKWNLGTRVAGEPEQFRKEAGLVFKALHERIQRENQELYPMAERAA